MDYAETLLEMKQEIGNLQSALANLTHLVYFLLALHVEQKFRKRK